MPLIHKNKGVYNFGFRKPTPKGNVSVQSGYTFVKAPPCMANHFPHTASCAGQRKPKKKKQQRGLAVESGKHPKEEIDHAKWGFLAN
jgi:hypothetical protein